MDEKTQTIFQTLESRGFDFIQQVGHGGFATAYLIKSRQYNQKFVAKVFDISQTGEERNASSFESEISALIQLIHPNIISIFDHFTTQNFLYLILEYCPNGTINDMIKEYSTPLLITTNSSEDPSPNISNADNKSCRGIPPPLLYNLALQILVALNFCQNRGIAHRDIKPANIFIDSYGRPKLADFGFATNFFNRKLEDTYAGSLPFMPLEILHLTPYDPAKADIWSLGVTFYIMATGYLPFKPKSPTHLAMLIATHEIEFPDYVEPEFADIIRSMLKVNPSERASISSILFTPFFRKIESSFNSERKVNRSYNRKHIRSSSSASDIAFTPRLNLGGNCLPSLKNEDSPKKFEVRQYNSKISSFSSLPKNRLASTKSLISSPLIRTPKPERSSLRTFAIGPGDI